MPPDPTLPSANSLRDAIFALRPQGGTEPGRLGRSSGWTPDIVDLYVYTGGALDMAEALRFALFPDVDHEDLVTWVHQAIRRTHPTFRPSVPNAP